MIKKKNDYLKLIEKKYETLFQSSKDALTILTIEDGFLHGNKAALEMYRCKNEEALISLDPSELSPKFQPDGSLSRIKALNMMKLALDKGVHLFEWKHKRLNGEEFFASVLLTKTELDGKTVLQATGRDISIQKKLEEENLKKRNLEKKYKLIFENSKDIIFVSNQKGNFLDINPAGVKILGYESKEELLKIDIKENLYLSRNKRDNFKAEMSKNGFVIDFQITLKKKDNTPIIILESATMVLDEVTQEKVYLGIMRDITQQLENEENLIKANIEQTLINEKLKETQGFLIQQEKMASLGVLAAGIAHEINNPLGFVMSNFKTLNKYMDKIKTYLELIEGISEMTKFNSADNLQNELIIKHKKEMNFIMSDLDDIFKESFDGFERIASIVENMRRFSRIDSVKNNSSMNLNDAIENTLVVVNNSYKYIAKVKKQFGTIPQIFCNAGEINQVLLNIIMNATHAIDQKKSDKMGLIEITTFLEEDLVCCKITDSGTGIPEHLLNKRFDPFFTTKPVGKGTGLGLSISYDIIVNKHKGMLLVSSSSKGTTFIIKLNQNLVKNR